MTTATRQIDRVLAVMDGGVWLTLAEIVADTRRCFDTIDTEAAASARLRDLRKYGHTVERRRRGGAGQLFEYRATPPVKAGEQTRLWEGT